MTRKNRSPASFGSVRIIISMRRPTEIKGKVELDCRCAGRDLSPALQT